MNQGEIWLVNLDPTIGAEIRKTRPCVIISDDSIGMLPLKLVAPLTDFKDRYLRVPWMVVITPDTVNKLQNLQPWTCFRFAGFSEERLIRKIGEITPQELVRGQEALKAVFGIS